ncbi:MAG: dipeptidase [Candidatus Methylomirabilis sp.]|nr:dipeptidase [Deltaproteobacteria bacterium]
MRKSASASAALLLALAGCSGSSGGAPSPLPSDPKSVHDRLTVLDLHVDTMLLVRFLGYPFEKRNAAPSGFEPWKGHADLPRLREGGADAVFFPIVTDGFCEGAACLEDGLAFARLTREEIAKLPGDMEQARTPADVERIVAGGRIAAVLAMEGLHPLGDDPESLRDYYDLGLRYAGLAHFNRNPYAQAAQARGDPEPDGLSEKGFEAVRLMNELGIIVDVAHGHPDSIRDAVAASRAPVLCSHTGVQGVYDVARNLDDATIRAIADGGGVVSIMTATLWIGPNSLVNSLDDVLDHVDYVVDLVGIDHVAFGSDFDGFVWVPPDLKDATGYPEITRRLLERGYSEEDLRKFWSGNVLRLWREAERVAAEMRAEE